MDAELSPLTIACAVAALRVARDSLDRPSLNFTAETQRKHQAEIDIALAELQAIEPAPRWERVPDGTYLTRHSDGIISYGGDQLSISKRQRRMTIFVGTLPDGWELHRRVKTEPAP